MVRSAVSGSHREQHSVDFCLYSPSPSFDCGEPTCNSIASPATCQINCRNSDCQFGGRCASRRRNVISSWIINQRESHALRKGAAVYDRRTSAPRDLRLAGAFFCPLEEP